MLMTVESLRIRFTNARLREPRGWFIPGSDPPQWLSEIVGWGVPHAAISLRLVPRSLGDRRPIGSLVTVDGKASPRVSSRCQPYGCLAERLFLPVEARLEPGVEDFELRNLFTSGTTCVWHPVAGLIRFDEDEVLSVADLLERPASTEADRDGGRLGRCRSGDDVQPPSPFGRIRSAAHRRVDLAGRARRHQPPIRRTRRIARAGGRGLRPSLGAGRRGAAGGNWLRDELGCVEAARFAKGDAARLARAAEPVVGDRGRARMALGARAASWGD